MNLQSTDFELFGLPPRFALDAGALDVRWKELQRQVHPDKFAAQGAAAQRVAMQWSARINEAYRRLKSPLQRAAYLCELNGAPIDAENNTAMPPAFLMQQMELREALAEVRGAPDPQARLDALLREIGGLIKTQIAQIAVQFEEATPEQLNAAVQTVQKMQFLNKLHAEAEAIEADLEEAL